VYIGQQKRLRAVLRGRGRGPKVGKTQDKALDFERNLKMLSEEEKRRKIPYNPFIKGATSLSQVRISPKVLVPNRLKLPCAICWLYVAYFYQVLLLIHSFT